MKKKLIVLLCLVLIGFVSLSVFISKSSSEDITNLSGPTANSANNKDSFNLDSTKKPSTTDDATIHNSNVEIDTTPDSYTVLVNKEYGLPEDYVPDDLIVPDIKYSFSYYDEKKLLRQVPATALEQLVAAAAEDSLTIKGVSGYRSYSRQKSIYNNNIKTKGLAHTERYSAKPGFSEHQTGLSIDVSADSNRNGLTEAFGNTSEGKWLANNCYKYGFIIRYPKGKESITGYSYEPWHIRYVGVELATYLSENNLTLEEYYNYTPAATIAPDAGSDDHDHDLEEVPTATPKTYTYTATPVPTKKPSSAYSATSTPKATSTPTATSTPKATKKPEKTAKPTQKPTSTPEATKKPVKTETPATKAPAKTKAPAVTHAPVKTEKPAVTAPSGSTESDKNESQEGSASEE